MQKLSFPLKIHVRKNGLRVIFVSHEHMGRHRLKTERPKQDDTRNFCNWIRQTFPDVPTEYRSTAKTTYRWDPVNRHFVAYDITPKEFMMIKLAFSFETVKVVFAKKREWYRDYWSKARRKTEVYTPGFLPRHNLHPSDELLARMAKNPGKYRKLTRKRKPKKKTTGA